MNENCCIGANIKKSQLCCVEIDADPLTQASKGLSLGSEKIIFHCSRLPDPLMGRAYLSVRATGWERLHPFPWKGGGPWVGVETLP